jgi:hypothetical protein
VLLVSHSKKVKKEKKRCQCWTVLDLLRLGAIQNELGAWDLISIVLNDPLEAHTTSVDFLLRTNAAIRFVTFFFPPPSARHPYVWEGSAGEQEQQQVGLAVATLFLSPLRSGSESLWSVTTSSSRVRCTWRQGS